MSFGNSERWRWKICFSTDLSRQLLKREHGCRNHMTQGIQKQVGALPAIEAKFHLFQVGREMLGTDSVPCSHDAALEKREGQFYGIGVNVSDDVDAGTVINLLVVCSLGLPHSRIVCRCVIGENDFHVLGNVLSDILRERSAFGVSRMEEAQIAVALPDADHDFLVVEFSDLAPASVPAPNIGNVHFDLAVKHRFISLRHCMPDAMAEVLG